MSLRLGVLCAVIDDTGSALRLLLVRRSDLKVWALPGGRLDAGERLEDAAARETHEETGMIVHVERPVGLYYLAGWRRLNVLYAAMPISGGLTETEETSGVGLFRRGELPPMPLAIIAHDSLADERQKPRVIETRPAEMRRLKARFALRWAMNALRGRPEPRFPRFEVRAVAVIWSNTGRRLITLTDGQGRTLPRVRCDGDRAPWLVLCELVQSLYGASPALRWAGVWQDTDSDALEFVFATTLTEKTLAEGAEWSVARGAALPDLDAAYVERVKPGYLNEPVWEMYTQEPDVTMITWNKEASE
jgi:ADP-ribose pyrophosphatase YjhB (NUDIX family)